MMTSFMATTASSSVFFAVAAYGDQFQPLDAISDGSVRTPESPYSATRLTDSHSRCDQFSTFAAHQELICVKSCGIWFPTAVLYIAWPMP